MSVSEQDLRQRIAELEAAKQALEDRLVRGGPIEEEIKSPMTRCEETGGHVVRPTVWPPPKIPTGNPLAPQAEPYLALLCDRCGCNVIVYDRPQAGVKVIKPVIKK